MKFPGSNAANKERRQGQLVLRAARGWSRQQIADALGVSVKTVERDFREIQQRALNELAGIDAEHWCALLWLEYRRRKADIADWLDQCGPSDKLAAARFLMLDQREDERFTKLLLALGLLREMPARDLVSVRVMRRMQQLPPEQLEEIYGAKGSEEEFAQLFRRLVQVPLRLIPSESDEEANDEDDEPDDGPAVAAD